MENVTNIYRGKYRTEDKLGPFETYWRKNGVKSKDNAVETVMRSIFGVLGDDIKNTRNDADLNA